MPRGKAVRWLDDLGRADLELAGELTPPDPVRREARAMLYGFVEYHLERRIRSFSLLARERPTGPGRDGLAPARDSTEPILASTLPMP